MSITDELREWWVRKFPIMDKELHKDFTAIADRIDGALECLRNWHQELADPDFWGVTRDWPIEHLWWRW